MAQQAKVVKIGPGGRNNGPRPKVENPGKVFKRILAYVMSRYKAQVIVVLMLHPAGSVRPAAGRYVLPER